MQEVLCSGCRSKIRRQRLNELGKAGISLGLDGVPILLKPSQSCDIQSMEIDNDDEGMKHISSGVIATDGLEINGEMTRKNDAFDTGKYEDVICFPPRTTTAVALKVDSSYSSNLMQISDDCTQSQNSRKDSVDSDESVNDVCDSESSLSNVLDQRNNSENLLHGENIEIQNDDIDLSMQTGAENIDVENSGKEKSLIILQNVPSTNSSLGKMDENFLHHIPIDAVITDSIEEQIERPLGVSKSHQISKIDALQSLERSDIKCNEKTHQQDNNNIQNNSENCDQHVMKCHRIGNFNELHGSVTAPFPSKRDIFTSSFNELHGSVTAPFPSRRDMSTSSFNELHGSVTAPFRSDMSTSSDASDNCAVISLSDDDDSNNQSSDRDDEILTPNNDQSLVAFLDKKRVDAVIIKPENQSAINLAIEIDDFPPPL